MNIGSHLSKEELEAYRSGELDGIELGVIERHLLLCGDCRRQMPKPTADELWAAVMTEHSVTAGHSVGQPFLPDLVRSFVARPAYASLYVALLALLGVSAFLLVDQLPSNESSEIALNVDQDNFEHDRHQRFPPQGKAQSPSDDRIETDPLRTGSSDTSRPPLKASVRKTTKPTPRLTPQPRLVRSETRGPKDSCGGQISLNGTVKFVDGEIELNWARVPEAIKYHVFVADLDERLVDEFASEKKTSHVIRTKLDPDVTYRWILQVSLEGGRSVTGAMQTFSRGGIAANAKKTTTAKVRCAQAEETND